MNIAFDFPFFLTLIVILTGVLSLIDVIFWAPKRQAQNKRMPLYMEYARSFFPVLLAVWLIRSFVMQPFRVPTGSLEPTILPGDLIVVNQFAYGIRLPVINKKIINVSEPKRGDIALFRWPGDTRIVYVKRVIGEPGDHVSYKNKILTVNGKVMHQHDLGMVLDQEYNMPFPVKLKSENLDSHEHKIFVRNDINDGEKFDIIVPPNQYFMMGDNRDNSDDSRDWGFVPEENLVGKAMLIWMSWDSQNFAVRWHRIGERIK